ncbi:hypothetical protein PRIPAC_79845, partial [Pristionchus pacificus]|uniref:Uncharacterized protein n=1 Tax=Pristionchus pacificus TaxID=54126 RepID=A0A2A6CLD1_PRIPA
VDGIGAERGARGAVRDAGQRVEKVDACGCNRLGSTRAWIGVAFFIVLFSYNYATGTLLADSVRTMLFFNVLCGKTPRVRMNDSLQGPNTPKYIFRQVWKNRMKSP